MRKNWRLLPHDAGRIEQLVHGASIAPVIAKLLVSRGVYCVDTARQFLQVRLNDLRDPLEFPGVDAASDLILQAIRDDRRITVYGDYDCDGMTGTAILVSCLQVLGGNVNYYVPNRLEDGYGLASDTIRRLVQHGTQFLISVDCGITSTEQANLCRQLNVPLVITDHHQIGAELPSADALVHARLPGSNYPFGEICGAGVAFKLAWALCQKHSGAKKVNERQRTFLMRALGLAAIGTVADMVPLVDENRVLVKHGLKSLAACPVPGMAELLRVTKLNEKPELTSEDIAFTIGPRLNAAGRLGQAQLGVELLTAPEGERATALADYIHQLNSTRETLERSVYSAAKKQIESDFDPESEPALVLAGSGWHLGVIGVVAGRIAEKYGRPTIVISMDSVGSKPAVGSGRAGGSVDLYAALSEASDSLITFGGHKAAAGLKLDDRKIDHFRGDFLEAVSRQLTDGVEASEIVIDAEASLAQLNVEVIRQIETLSPFGQGNPRPVLLASGVVLCEPSRRMGGGDRHLTVRLEQQGMKIRTVAFGCGDWCEELNQLDGPIDIAYRPVINEYQGRRSVEAQLVDWRPSKVPSDALTSQNS